MVAEGIGLAQTARAYHGVGRERVPRYQRLNCPHSVCREKRPYRVVDYPRDTLLGWVRRHLEDEGQKQRSLAHEHELHGRELTVADRLLPMPTATIEIFGEAVDG